MLEYWGPGEELPKGFEGEEDRANLNQNMVDLFNLWQRQYHESTNGTASEIHAPPALVATFFNALVQTHEPPLDDDDRMFIGQIAGWCAGAFNFGQYCYKNGLLVGNLEQDRCARVNDDDILKLLES